MTLGAQRLRAVGATRVDTVCALLCPICEVQLFTWPLQDHPGLESLLLESDDHSRQEDEKFKHSQQDQVKTHTYM